MADVLEELGARSCFLGGPALAAGYSEESLALRQALDDRVGMVRSLANLGRAAGWQGQLEEAERLLRECLAQRQELQWNRDYEVRTLGSLGNFLSAQGRFSEARTHLEECLAVCAKYGYTRTVAWSNLFLGLLDLHLGRYEAARARGQAALETARALDHQPLLGLSNILLGCVALVAMRDEEALALLRKSVDIYRQEIGQRWGGPLAQGVLGLATAGQGDGLEAW
jgi:tetratricopeptide (TPR) repeat protein